MQTFLPFADFQKSAEVLDYKRLGKQRVECAQLLTANAKRPRSTKGWVNHPAAHMWEPYPEALKLYMDAMVREWVRRGYKNNYELHYPNIEIQPVPNIEMPIWLGDPELHRSHRIALLAKTDYYEQFDWPELAENTWNWDTPLDQTYWWPRLTLTDQEVTYVLRRKGDY